MKLFVHIHGSFQRSRTLPSNGLGGKIHTEVGAQCHRTSGFVFKPNKYNMADLMMSLELAMAALSEINSTVVDESVGEDYERRRSRWVAEVEIGIVGRIFQVPKTEVGKTLADQEAELSATCAEFVASKMQDLPKMRNPPLTLAYLLGIATNIKEKYSSSFWQAIVKLLEDPSLESKTDISNGKHDKKIQGRADARAQSAQAGCRWKANRWT